MTKRLVYIQNKINNAAIRRIKNDRGDLVYVVPSYTLPDDITMNGIKYPSDEIASSYHTLEGTPAPLGHPYDSDGNWIQANSEDGILYFQCGIFNKNVQRVEDEKYGHRVYVEKHIHVETAMQTERGQAVINAIDKGESIHTSTGILMDVVNVNGEDTASGMLFDHDAILLDEEGAATPDDGVGLMVNSNLFKTVRRNSELMHVNTVVNASTNDLERSLQSEIHKRFGDDDNYPWVSEIDIDDNFIIFVVGSTYYRLGFVRDGEEVSINDKPVEVKGKMTWTAIDSSLDKKFTTPVNNGTTQTKEGKDMFKEHIQSVLTANSVDYSEMDDNAQIAAYDKIKANAAETPKVEGEQSQPDTVSKAEIEQIVANALASQQSANEVGTRSDLADKLKTNGVDLSEAEQKAMSVNSLQSLVEKTTPKPQSYGLMGTQLQANQSDESFDSLPE